MKNWIKYALYGALVGLIIGIIHFIFPSYALFRLSLPLSFIYTPLMKVLVKQFTLIQSVSTFYLIALLVEGFIVGAIMGLLAKLIKTKRKSSKSILIKKQNVQKKAKMKNKSNKKTKRK